MSEYDIALDKQIELANFWTSDHGISLYGGIIRGLSRLRAEKGERNAEDILGQIEDHYIVSMMPIINGDCFYWSRDMINICLAASQSLPDSWSLMKPHIPATSGFFWLDRILDEKPYNRLLAIGWTIMRAEGDIAEIYMRQKDGSMPDFNSIDLVFFVDNPEFPKPLPCFTKIKIGQTLADYKLDMSDYAVSINANPDEFINLSNMRLFATMLSFIQQKLLVASRQAASRATRRRAIASKREAEAEVNVIRLRRLIYRAHESAEGLPVEWSCQWIVRGHWRNQWYPSLTKNQPIWINPYLKGPEDKPLRNPGKLFAVVR